MDDRGPGSATALVLLALGVPYSFALGLVVLVLDLIPLAGATLAAVIVSLVAFLPATTAGIILLVYQQLENHLLQPVVYGRTVQLSPLVVLISVLIGAELAGILGALGAIPIAGSLQVLLRDYLEHRGHGALPDRDGDRRRRGRPRLAEANRRDAGRTPAATARAS